jgi:hypothetical protein
MTLSKLGSTGSPSCGQLLFGKWDELVVVTRLGAANVLRTGLAKLKLGEGWCQVLGCWVPGELCFSFVRSDCG